MSKDNDFRWNITSEWTKLENKVVGIGWIDFNNKERKYEFFVHKDNKLTFSSWDIDEFSNFVQGFCKGYDYGWRSTVERKLNVLGEI